MRTSRAVAGIARTSESRVTTIFTGASSGTNRPETSSEIRYGKPGRKFPNLGRSVPGVGTLPYPTSASPLTMGLWSAASISGDGASSRVRYVPTNAGLRSGPVGSRLGASGPSEGDRRHSLTRGKLFIPRRLGRGGSPAVVQSPAPSSPGPPCSEACTPPLGCSGATSEDVHSAVETPFLDGQRRLVPKARALSHYSGDAF